MGCTIRQINYDRVVELNIKDNKLIFNPNSKYFALIEDNIVKSLIALKTVKGGIKLQANYTFPEYRNVGLFSYLLNFVINYYAKDVNIYADCVKDSIGIYIKNGFELFEIKEFKSFTIYKVRLLRNGVCEENK